MSATSRTNALTAIAPLAPWRLWWCRLVLPVLRILSTSSSLARLRSIHFGGWIVFGDLPGTGRSGTTGPGWRAGWRSRPGMLFLSNYDGELAEYIAAFGIAVEPGMRWSFGSAEGFPGTRPSRRFVDYVDRQRVAELWSWSAFPDRTVRDLDTALAVSELMPRLVAVAGDPYADDARFRAVYRELLALVAQAPEPRVPGLWQGIWQALRPCSVEGMVVVLPLEPDRSEDVRRSVAALAASEPSLFEQVGGVHFGRVAILPVAGRGGGHADFLLLAAWVDGTPEAFVERLVGVFGRRADALFGAAAGYPGAEDPTVLGRWIGGHRLRFSLFLACRNGVSTADIDTALRHWERAVGFVDKVRDLPLPEVRRELRALWP
jgi:hypothetical protein